MEDAMELKPCFKTFKKSLLNLWVLACHVSLYWLFTPEGNWSIQLRPLEVGASPLQHLHSGTHNFSVLVYVLLHVKRREEIILYTAAQPQGTMMIFWLSSCLLSIWTWSKKPVSLRLTLRSALSIHSQNAYTRSSATRTTWKTSGIQILMGIFNCSYGEMGEVV